VLHEKQRIAWKARDFVDFTREDVERLRGHSPLGLTDPRLLPLFFMNLRLRLISCLVTVGLSGGTAPLFSASSTTMDKLKVSKNHRFLVHEDGRPFFYLGDTAWELFHRLNREEADRYLENRARKGFTVIQAVALAELDGLNDPNAYGHRPLLDNDPTRPDVKDGPNNDYWDHVDYIVNKAESLGLQIGFLPTWADKWMKGGWGVGPEIFTPANARIYGEWLGRRYQAKSIIWILGGDRPVENETQRAIQQALAEGLRAGDGGAHLITFHPPGGQGSSKWFHAEPWLDFNMRQNGHSPEYRNYANTLVDYQREGIKPVIDGEPLYEDHPVSFKAAEFGHSVATDVRRPLYWDLFNGAFGHTYGHHSIWQMYQPGKVAVNGPLMFWTEALGAPGSAQMQYARWLLESRPFLTRIPDPSLIVQQEPASAWPGAGIYHFAATRDESGSYAMVYAPAGRKFKVRLDALSGSMLRAWWFNPRDGTAQILGEFPKTAEHEFLPPNPGELLDWVLVIDDASRNFTAPGARP
jgi:Protein of unknown function (DUF4038)/Putative collagen-binding domain of a collagenase